jgi:hypothetical protein
MRYVSALDLPNSIDRAGELTRNHKKTVPHGLGRNRSFHTDARIVDNLEHTIDDDECLPSGY